MATKKNTAAEQEPEITEEVETETRKEPASEWDEEVEMIVPRKSKGDDQSYYVCVNDRRFQIPANGKMQTLPAPIAEALRNSLEAEAEAEEYADKIPNRDGADIANAVTM